MFKKILFILAIFILINSSLFAYSNKYFSVDETGWERTDNSEKSFTYKLKRSYLEEENISFTPNITINYLESEDKDLISNYTQNELNDIKVAFENKDFKQRLESAKQESIKVLEQKKK